MIDFLTKNIIVIVTIIVYGIVFVIQRAQFKKQNEIMSKYEKVFAIFNIDEIEKYVELQKKSVSLSFGNREIELSNLENEFSQKLTKIEETLNSSKSNLEKSKEISKSFKNVFNSTKDFNKELLKIVKNEFTEMYTVIEQSTIKSKNPELYKEIENQLINIAKKYNEQKMELLSKVNVDEK